MKRWFSIIVLALMLALAACDATTREARRMVKRAERLADTLPDSTVRLIDSVLRMPVNFHERERMDMALLQAEALFGDRGQEISPVMDDEFFDDRGNLSTSPELERAAAYYAKKAFPAAYNALGNLYRSGSGVKADATQAFGWYMKGANANDAQAMLNVGNCYFYGMGTVKDDKAAVNWWKDAADAGNAYAQSQMGDCYYFGIGVAKDLKKAIEYYKPAADQNISSAQYRLGLLYYNGEGVEQDRTYAKLLMQKARDGGDKDAQAFLEKNF